MLQIQLSNFNELDVDFRSYGYALIYDLVKNTYRSLKVTSYAVLLNRGLPEEESHFVLVSEPFENPFIFVDVDRYRVVEDTGLTATSTLTYDIPFSSGLNLLEYSLYTSSSFKVPASFDREFFRSAGVYYMLCSVDFKQYYKSLY